MSDGLSFSLMVGAGGFAGSVARYGLSLTAQRLSIQWPAGTLAANILGCLIIGVITGISARGETLSPEARLVLATGFCGGFTTMSSMVYETAAMIRASEYLHAVAYAAGTFFLSLAAFGAGIVGLRIIARIGGGLWS
ncbi:MAG: fluoride efflux transporter CrcB [Deltaproteobacteria bacterium]|nr:fluoride efflux transporter CrcB [Deltaproteobacteria bacterium]